ncbi:MAG: S1 RNA-binding domain-containing protein [Clostridium sp.]
MGLDFKINTELLEFNKKVNYEDISANQFKTDLENSINQNTVFTGFCKRAYRDGSLEIDCNGVPCRLDIEDFTVTDATVRRHWAQTKVGTYVSFRVKSVADDIVNVERKSIIKDIRDRFKALRVGHNVHGIVTRIDENKGVFVCIGGDTYGMIPKPYLESIFIKNLSDHVSVGDKVYVKVAELQRNTDDEISHLIFNRKVLLPTFDELASDIELYEIHIAKVKAVTDKGIHCSLTPHLDIYCEFAPGVRVKPNDMVQVKITRIRPEKQRINGDIIGVL